MSKLKKFRQENPDYKDVPEEDLIPALYNKYYKDRMSPQEFSSKIVQSEMQSAQQPKYDVSPAEAGIMGAAQGLSFGLADEAAGLVGGGISAVKGDGFKKGYSDVMAQQKEALQASREQQGGAMLGGELAGGVATGIAGGAKLAGTKLGQALFRKPKTAALGTGALSGGTYGFTTGDGGVEERLQEVPMSAAMGAAGGLGGLFLSRGIGKLLDKKPTKEAIKNVEQSLKNKTDDMVSLGGSRMADIATPDILAQQGKSVTMPKGAASGDVNLMRLEEAARQGQFGDELQSKINLLDDRTKAEVLDRIQSMIGKTDADSESLLSKGIQDIKSRYKSSKAMQSKLMNARNDALSKTSVYKDYVKETLGDQLKELKKLPDFDIALQKSTSAPIKEEFKILDNVLKTKSATGVNMKFLNAWRAGLNNYKPGTEEGVLASKMKNVYDNWLDNIALSDAIKAGDEDIAEKIFTANKSYSKFKSLYGTNKYAGQNSAIEKILTQEELTPMQAVNALFGKSINGNNYTAQNLKRLLKGVEGSAKETAVKNNLRAGLIARVYEDSTKRGDLSLSQLKNNLIKLRRSEAYKMNLSAPEYDTIIDGLITDLGKVVDSQSRRDVYSPSAPAVMRGLAGLFDKAGYVLPSARAVAQGVDVAGKAATKRPQGKVLEKSIQELLDEATNVMSRERGIYGTIAGGVAPQPLFNQEEQ